MPVSIVSVGTELIQRGPTLNRARPQSPSVRAGRFTAYRLNVYRLNVYRLNVYRLNVCCK